MTTLKVSRRGLIRTSAMAAAAIALPQYLRASNPNSFTNAPGDNEVILGLNVPQKGLYVDEGTDVRQGFELAVDHLNGRGDGGMLNTFSSKVLDGTGILGREVKFVVGDTETNADAASASAIAMIKNDRATMITGGVSSSVAVAMQALCQDAGVIFMASQTHSNDTTGKDRKANGFRHFFNSYMSGAALAPVLAAQYGTDRKAYHLTADYNWGYTTEEAIASSTEAMGWETMRTVKTPLSIADFTPYIIPILDSGADTLVLNHYGANMVASVANAVDVGLKDREVNGRKFEIVVPLYSRLMARQAAQHIDGVFGSINWHWTLKDEGSKAFVQSFRAKYGIPPDQAAHTAYVQTVLYADAVTRAGSFNPCAVTEALEDYAFDGLGNGPTFYRGEDHQCFKDVLIVKGKAKPETAYDLLEIVEITPAEQVTYAPDHPQFQGGSLGTCSVGI